MSQTIAHFQSANGALITFAADAFSTSPQFTPAEFNLRRQVAVNLTMAFLPTEPVQTMLATQTTGFHMSVIDGFREIAAAPMGSATSVRLRMANVAQARTIMRLMGEMRMVRKSALAAAEAEAEVAARANSPAPTPTVTAQAAPAAEGADGGRFQAAAAEPQAAASLMPETLAGARGANPEEARQVPNGLAESIPAALAEPGRMGLDPTPEQAGAKAITGSRAQRRAEMKRQGAFRRIG